jgi:hypothetical protein
MEILLHEVKSESYRSRYLPSELVEQIMHVQTQILEASIPVIRIAAAELLFRSTGQVIDASAKLVNLRSTFVLWEPDDRAPWKAELPTIQMTDRCRELVQAVLDVLETALIEEEEIMKQIIQQMESNITMLDRIYEAGIPLVLGQPPEKHTNIASHHPDECNICKRRLQAPRPASRLTDNIDIRTEQIQRYAKILQRSDLELGKLRVEMRGQIHEVKWQRDEARRLLKAGDLRSLFNNSWKSCIWLLEFKAYVMRVEGGRLRS